MRVALTDPCSVAGPSDTVKRNSRIGVPLGQGGACQRPKGRFSVRTPDWHQKRELRSMQAEDDASRIADRGRCGVVPRGGGQQCKHPKSRCPKHAAEQERCQSALDNDPRERCWKHRAEKSCFCTLHADYPNYSKTVQRWAADRQQRGLSFDEEQFTAHIRAEYPNASYQQPKIYDFQKYAASLAGAAAERPRSRSPKRP